MTYLLIDKQNHALAQTALRSSQIAFPLKNRLVFSDVEDGWDESDFIKVDPIHSVRGYCTFLLKHAWKFVKTEFLFEHLPPSKNRHKFGEFKVGCRALGIDETGHDGFSQWCVESRDCQNMSYQLSHG